MLPLARYSDPSPSRIRYRFERLWLKPSVRQLVRFWLPLAVVGSIVWGVSSNSTVREVTQSTWAELYETVAARPEFEVRDVVFPNVSDDLQQQILMITGIELPVSSLELDVAVVKSAIETLDAVKSAEVRVMAGGTLEISAVERQPSVVWRDNDTLRLMDNEGNRVAELARRSARGDLPLIVGESAELSISEALSLVEVVSPIADRLRGFVRVGERRWDVVLDRGQTIMLPEVGSVTALRRVMALHQAEDLLNRDVVLVDMRNSERPVLRLTEEAIAELRRLRTIVRGEDA